MKDYYQILGVDASTPPDQLKKAYRTLAMKYHPDRNPGDKAAEERFKEISEAYEILSDPGKRQQWEHGQRPGGNPQNGGGWEFRAGRPGAGDPFEGIFENLFRGQGFGPGFGAGFGRQPARNPDTTVQLNITLEDAYHGKMVPIQFTDSDGRAVNLSVTIPPGVEPNTRFRYSGNGRQSDSTLPPGDLYVVIGIVHHPRFERNGAHLRCSASIPLWRTLVGGEVIVETIEGSRVSLKIPALTAEGTNLRMRERGMPMREDPTTRGDLIVQIRVEMPTSLTPEQIEQIANWDNG